MTRLGPPAVAARAAQTNSGMPPHGPGERCVRSERCARGIYTPPPPTARPTLALTRRAQTRSAAAAAAAGSRDSNSRA
eukprot:scaffold1911_cov397-Prasinococcus_capsulatus_cf.AAC.2